MPLDPSVALQVKQPDFDSSKTLNALANYQTAGAHAQLYGMQARLQEMKIGLAQKVGQAMQGNDDNATQNAIEQYSSLFPEEGKALQAVHQGKRIAMTGNQQAASGSQNPEAYNAFPDVKQTVTDTLAKQDTNTRANTVQRLSLGGSLASKYKADPSPSSWNEGVDQMENSKLFTPDEIKALRNEPTEKHMQHALSLQAGAQTAEEYMKNSGQAAGNLPHAASPETSFVAPNPSAPGALPRASTAGGLTANSNPAAAKADQESDPRYKEVPAVDIGDNGPRQPGVLFQGQNPSTLAAKNASIEHYNKDIVPAGNAAARAQSELGVIRSSLESGKLSTGILAKVKETAAQFIYEGSGKNLKLAKDLTGIDPSVSETMNKSSMRLGFDMSRAQGAREAVQVITMALQANPNMLNTKEGALKLVGLLDQTAQWDRDNEDYAGKYLTKNKHIVGFDSWMQNKHPIEQYTSQAVPYQNPGSPDKLKDGVTYENGKGEKGKWDKTNNHFVPVQ